MVLARTKKLDLDGPVKLSDDEKNSLVTALGLNNQAPSLLEEHGVDAGVMPENNNFVSVIDQLLSALHLRQKTNITRNERNGLAALDAGVLLLRWCRPAARPSAHRVLLRPLPPGCRGRPRRSG